MLHSQIMFQTHMSRNQAELNVVILWPNPLSISKYKIGVLCLIILPKLLYARLNVSKREQSFLAIGNLLFCFEGFFFIIGPVMSHDIGLWHNQLGFPYTFCFFLRVCLRIKHADNMSV